MVIKNSDILFIYECKLCNPNGDPDEENMPRMDREFGVNLVSDVRLKRFFRDFLVDKFGWKKVWVTKVEGKHVDATERVSKITSSENRDEIIDAVLNNCIDARIFGATIPLKGGGKKEKEKGKSISIIGPVQFTWGFSLHKVDLVESSAITSIFKGREVEAEAGTIGRDFRVYYSMIAFYGRVSGRRAEESKMTDDDLSLLDKHLWDSVNLLSSTRSKIGHRPLLYLRIEYDEDFSLGDLRRFIERAFKENVREIDNVGLKFNRLIVKLSEVSSVINRIVMLIDEDFEGKYKLFSAMKEKDKLKNKIEIIE